MHEQTPEYVDWLGENGKVLGQVDKNFAHVHGLLHPAAHIFVVEGNRKLIMQFRSHTKKIYPRHWDTSVGGHVGAGEELVKGAQREMHEELGIQTKINYLGSIFVSRREKNYLHVERMGYFWAQLKQGTRIHPNEEFEKVERVPIEKVNAFIQKKKCTPMFVQGWKKFGPQILRKVK